ncbi:MAG: hypothetical protein ACYCZL_13775 [Polaromonas sp.]
MAPTLFTACNALPPEGAVSPWGGPAVKRAATLDASNSRSVTLIGAGNIGGGMAVHWLDQDWRVEVCAIDPARVADPVQIGL